MPDAVVHDQDQRTRALDIGESFIVQAPAGSGKTELLTQRYLRLLVAVKHPEEIYAITFTRKAAAEMRNRILNALDLALDPEPSEAHKRTTWQLARDVLARDAEHDWQLANNPNRLRIQTFDSLSHALARQMPLLSELGAAPSTTENAAPYYQAAARATLRMLDDPQLGDHVERLLVHLDSRQEQLEGLLCRMLARRDQWLAHALSSPDGNAIEDALRVAVTEHLQRLHETSPADWLHQMAVVAQQAASNLLADAGSTLPSGLETWIDNDDVPGTDWSDLNRWCGLAELLLTGKDEPRKSWTNKQGFPAPSEKGLDPDAKKQRTQAKQDIKALSEHLHEDSELLRLWSGVRRLPRRGPDAGQHAVLCSLFHVLLHAAAELQLVFEEQGEVDFIEVQLRAQRALGNPEEPTDLALTLDYRLQHLLVDEFQDTSSGQYRLLATLTAGWQNGDGRTLFAVGDPMQSIYRFREAEVGLYLAAREYGIGQLKLHALTLSVNFRSTAAIVDWVNTGFPCVLPERIDVGRGAVPYSPAVAFAGDAASHDEAVHVHPLVGNDPQTEAARVIGLIHDALTETDQGQVAVLARARSHLYPIADTLKVAGIGFQAVDVFPLSQQPVVRDLYALTRALLHPADRLSWLVMLRAPWIGLELNDLLVLAESSNRSLLARLRDPALAPALSEDGRSRIQRLLSVIDRHLPARGRQPLRQWIESIWLSLGGLAAAGSAADADAQAYLQLLDQYEDGGGLIDFADLDSALLGLYASPDTRSDGRVQLMTMHKSKGLEFDTVILPGLGRSTRGNDSELLYWLERTADDGRSQLLMAPIRAATQDREPISDYLRELDRDKDRLEQSRLLYVAATRAKRRLHLLGHLGSNTKGIADKPTSGSLLEKLWPIVQPAFTQLQAPESAQAPAELPLRELQRLPADWRPNINEAPPSETSDAQSPSQTEEIEFSWAGDTARHVGTLVHRYLERIANEGLAQWPQVRIDDLTGTVQRGLRNLGVDNDELDRAVAKTLRALRNTLDDETGRWILDRHADAACEWPLTLRTERIAHYVIDRTFIDDDGTRWIIDYKTGDHLEDDRDTFLDQELERYRAQLENYGRIVHLLEQRPIKLALYFPLFADWRVWDYQSNSDDGRN